ncbi:MAG: substrate-binding domain-containing protein [Acidimicrobiia bacterium]
MTRRTPRVGLALTCVLLVASTLVPAGAAGAASAITGGGSSFASLEIDQWRADTARRPYGLQVNYVSQGSTFGRTEFIEGHLDYGASDITFQQTEIPQLQSRRCGGRAPDTGCFVYVPVSAGGLAFMYNLVDNSGQRVGNLRLSRRAACKVFTGAIKRWDDPELVATNPQLAGVSRDIVPVIRGDGAGESFVFSQFCIAVAKDIWDGFRAQQIRDDPQNIATDFRDGLPVSNWPQNWGRSVPALYADGAANVVADPVSGRDTITYVAAGYAKVRSFPVASLQNAAGQFTQPDEANVTIALGYATGRGDGTFILNFTGPDPQAYFPSTYSYVLAQTTGFDPGKGAALGQFLCYAVSAGQVIAPQLRYARLSKPLVDIAIAAISRIPGAPPSNQCFVAGAPAPPPLPGVHGPGASGTGGSSADAAAASQQAQAQQAAAEAAAAAARRARIAQLRQKNIDDQLVAAAGHQRTGGSVGVIWVLLLGAVLAAAAGFVFSMVRKSSP